jgi:hypothetical protein
MKLPNTEEQSSTEIVEGRQRPKENDPQSNTSPTQSGERVSQRLSGVRRTAQERKKERFTALLHQVTLKSAAEELQSLEDSRQPGKGHRDCLEKNPQQSNGRDFSNPIVWLPGMDSNHDSRLQRPLSYH